MLHDNKYLHTYYIYFLTTGVCTYLQGCGKCETISQNHTDVDVAPFLTARELIPYNTFNITLIRNHGFSCQVSWILH